MSSSTQNQKTYDSDGFSEEDEASPEQTHLDYLYKNALLNIRKNSNKISKEHLLYFYARYKFITEGTCNTKRPSFIQLEAKAKWDAWNDLKKSYPNLTPEMARQQYCERLDKVSPGWSNELKDDDTFGQANENGTFGIRASAMASNEIELNECDKTCFDLCKEGSLDKLKLYLSKGGSINQVDDNHMTLLMWACDRGSLELVKYLVGADNVDLNLRDAEGQTCLHYAASCEHRDVVKFLLSMESMKSDLVDSEGLLASESTDNEEILNLFK